MMIPVGDGVQRTLLRLYPSGRIGDLISNPRQLNDTLRIMDNVVVLPAVTCADGDLSCTVTALVQSAAAAHGTVYRTAITVEPGARGRPKLQLNDLQPGRYRLAITVVRGGRRAGVTTEPVLLDAKGRIVKQHKAKQH
jgi:hypothetical protein